MRNQNAAKKTFKNLSVNSDLCLGPFFPGTSFLILLDTRDTPGSVFFDIVFSFFFFKNRNKTNAMNFKKKKIETSLRHILSQKCLKSFYFVSLL